MFKALPRSLCSNGRLLSSNFHVLHPHQRLVDYATLSRKSRLFWFRILLIKEADITWKQSTLNWYPSLVIYTSISAFFLPACDDSWSSLHHPWIYLLRWTEVQTDSLKTIYSIKWPLLATVTRQFYQLDKNIINRWHCFYCERGGAYEILNYRITVDFFDNYRNTVIKFL